MRDFYKSIIKETLLKGEFKWLFSQVWKILSVYLSCKIGKPICGPLLGTIFLTYRCNNSCKQCDLPSLGNLRNEFLFEDIKNVIDGFHKLKISAISYTGGEPLLRNDILDVISYTRSKGIYAHLNTNAYLLDRRLSKELIKSGVNSINISLDGYKAETHNKLRGVKDGYEKIMDAIRFINEYRQKYSSKTILNLVTVISLDNYKEIKDLIRLKDELKVDNISFMPLHIFDVKPFRLVPDKRLANKESKQMLEVINLLIKNNSKIDNSKKYVTLFPLCFKARDLPIKCYAPYNSIIVDCYGDIFPCFPYAEIKNSFNNLKNIKDLYSYWFSEEYTNHRKKLSDCRVCFWNCHTELNLIYSFTSFKNKFCL